MSKENKLLAVFSLIFIFSIIMIFDQQSGITGYATTGTTVSNVTISSYLAIAMSTNLQAGILFGTVDALPATDLNASHNYDGASSASTMFINVSTDSNAAVDFCIQANAALTDSVGGNIIGIGNETYLNSTITNSTLPGLSTSSALLTTSYAKAGINIGQGNVSYYRFWLDVPVATSPATYNNSIMFKGVTTGSSC
ncbi:hypothetical protein FJZ19_06135 [Candidatus Pacearchaeota archaeon]|nr:hypothetical protein [Candidatus Pacearchaeota archaeon]